MSALVALVQSALTGALVRAASDAGLYQDARAIASWSRSYARTAGLSVPMPLPRATREAYSDETEVES